MPPGVAGGLPLVAAVEAGGTKCVAAFGRTWEEVRDSEKLVVATGPPEATVRTIVDWFAGQDPGSTIAAIGVGAFGPVDLGRRRVARTPKPGWTGFDWAGALAHRYPGAPLGFDTDTAAAAVAEWRWGAAAGASTAAYITVGTGIGAGLVVGGRLHHGLAHPEIGHMLVPRSPSDAYPGRCPFHGDCLEGLASGPAMEERWGVPPRELPAGHPAWSLEAGYLAAAVVNLVMTLSPETIVIGGGVMAAPGLLEEIRSSALRLLGGYIDRPELDAGMARFVVAPALGPAAGVVGAFELGRDALAATAATPPSVP